MVGYNQQRIYRSSLPIHLETSGHLLRKIEDGPAHLDDYMFSLLHLVHAPLLERHSFNKRYACIASSIIIDIIFQKFAAIICSAYSIAPNVTPMAR